MSEVIAERGKAQLVRNDDGSLSCRCPYACLATYEPCEFAPPFVVPTEQAKATDQAVNE